MLLMRKKSVKSPIYFRMYDKFNFYKFILIMEKKYSKAIAEVVKAILYALLGLLGGNAIS